MKNLSLTLLAATLLVSNPASAFLVKNSESCEANNASHVERIDYDMINAADSQLGDWAAKVNSIEGQPLRFSARITADTVIRGGDVLVDVAQDTTEGVHKMVRYATVDLDACLHESSNLGQGIDCMIVMPNKVITVAATSVTDIGADLSVGVYSVGSGALGAASELSTAIANGLRGDDSGDYTNIKDPGDLAAVPFAVVSFALDKTDVVARIVLVDTVGGGFNQLGQAVRTLTTDVCDIFRSLNIFSSDNFNPVNAVGHTAGLVLDAAAETLNLGFHILTLGQASLRDEAAAAGAELDLTVDQ